VKKHKKVIKPQPFITDIKKTNKSSGDSKVLIQLNQVGKTYSSEAGDFPALSDINLTIFMGENLGVIGKSGAGKSTLLNMITGVDHLTSGEVIAYTNGMPVSIHSLTENDLALWRGRNIGVIYQSFQLLPMLTLVENVMLPMDLCGNFKRKESRERAVELLRMVELHDHVFKLPGAISGGQQQRVAIARALANDPPILVADEPTGSLDSITAAHIFEVFEQLVDQGKTIVMVTHDNGLAPRFSRSLQLTDGILASTGHEENQIPVNARVS
jgi:putative ABC transport system ATP-binding protein